MRRSVRGAGVGEARLALLRVVLRARVRARDDAQLSRQALRCEVPQCEVPRTPDGVHALLSVVPREDPASMEARGQRNALPALPMGRRHALLALLPVVHEGARRLSTRAD